MRQMRHRYGALPEAAVATILAAQPAELDLWADAIFEAEALPICSPAGWMPEQSNHSLTENSSGGRVPPPPVFQARY